MEYFEVTKKSKGFDGVMHIVRLSECPIMSECDEISLISHQPTN